MADYDYTDVSTGEDLTDSEMEDIFQDALDDIYGEVDIAGYPMSTGRILREVDYTAFREGLNNWIDSEIQEGTYREYVDSPECEDCKTPLTQDDVTESMANYDRLVCPTCGQGEDDDECDTWGKAPNGADVICTVAGEHTTHIAQAYDMHNVYEIAGVVWE